MPDFENPRLFGKVNPKHVDTVERVIIIGTPPRTGSCWISNGVRLLTEAQDIPYIIQRGSPTDIRYRYRRSFLTWQAVIWCKKLLRLSL